MEYYYGYRKEYRVDKLGKEYPSSTTTWIIQNMRNFSTKGEVGVSVTLLCHHPMLILICLVCILPKTFESFYCIQSRVEQQCRLSFIRWFFTKYKIFLLSEDIPPWNHLYKTMLGISTDLFRLWNNIIIMDTGVIGVGGVVWRLKSSC